LITQKTVIDYDYPMSGVDSSAALDHVTNYRKKPRICLVIHAEAHGNYE